MCRESDSLSCSSKAEWGAPLSGNHRKSGCFGRRYFHCAAHNLDLANGSSAAGKTSDAECNCDGDVVLAASVP